MKSGVLEIAEDHVAKVAFYRAIGVELPRTPSPVIVRLRAGQHRQNVVARSLANGRHQKGWPA